MTFMPITGQELPKLIWKRWSRSREWWVFFCSSYRDYLPIFIEIEETYYNSKKVPKANSDFELIDVHDYGISMIVGAKKNRMNADQLKAIFLKYDAIMANQLADDRDHIVCADKGDLMTIHSCMNMMNAIAMIATIEQSKSK